MKTSLIGSRFFSHSTNRILEFIVPFLLSLFITSAATQITLISKPHHDMLHTGWRHHSCHPVATQQPPATICFRRNRVCYCVPFQPPPPQDDGHEIDPRYGVETRLVPSGPNPLHN